MSATEAKTVSKSALRKGKPKAGVEGLLRVVEGSPIVMDPSRDSLLTEFGKKTLQDRYLLPGESYQDMFARVSLAFADDTEHAQRLYDYMSKLWFMPATPVLSNGGAARGLPISCFLNQVGDSLDDIVETWTENVWLASNGGGIGTYWGNVRSIGEKVGQNGQTSGIIPFIRVMDSLTLAISQGSLRRGSAACYIDVHHPEIEEFLEIRKASGDFNRKSLNLHHGINITDDFMEAVKNDEDYGLISPKSKEVIRTINARKLWQKILELRMQTGEPYLLFTDTVNNAMPAHQRKLGLKVTQSNLCSEITLPTGVDHAGQDRTAVCCLSSVNAEKYLEWSKDETFIEDIFRFLDNVLEDFIERAPPEMARAVYSAKRERSVGLGLMGFHSFLQTMNVPLESAMSKVWNEKMFKHIRQGADAASVKLAKERGPCEDARDVGMMARFSHKMAVAPTASISIICGGTSAGIEPIPANVYTHKTLSGSFTVKNQQLQRLLASKDMDTDEVWTSILEHEGSIQHLECLDEHEKSVFKTAFEIDQRWIIELAADRTPYICQSQSLNLFLPGDIAKWDLHMLHWTAWERGLKSLYYCRSKSVQRAAFAGSEKSEVQKMDTPNTDYDECLACQ
ncbi:MULTISPECIES: ribonucleoside-diphosphate reductase subunit alpha [unclassified Hyphomonas]|jgi:ribonucleoside-diphosphate reductase alpha chain|uniref:ribonucleoside-diphosphate reductase n=3 Tax=root TaxID=1 RepID=A0A160TYV1_9ZZZZ|nr:MULTISPECIES: ribonucleoside-diphosphate reductase subunit alpha [unclassified Hyphomonas]KCZ62647.1 ribonucleotide-diphosphate reductase subunit alpha [Hyphomonas sp. L-53-1-40]MAL43123.1 ribonucleotide-diphosphate reductase subunit alpha [Hyphomonas sp.]MBG68428.1 ribonucleotide-diphosphate reductase subunit alpha [Hyphomonas sp.]MBO6583188.1 ribonucleoside-diphosphate reductase subunit alpha [Hyphomonas sp.]QSR21433.1 ribonucleotide-diphosphate reductase subunit alpha [Hyphomonas sp. KY3|tara:strand:+ start:28 stop:1896 length:1869 start_codon:yes stop_codon:yes gene_type:complete